MTITANPLAEISIMEGGKGEKSYVSYQQATINAAITPTSPHVAPHSEFQDRLSRIRKFILRQPPYWEPTSGEPNYSMQSEILTILQECEGPSIQYVSG